MISDTLSDAASEIRRYLNDETFARHYTGQTRTEIETLVAEMDRTRVILDAPPTPTLDIPL
jgi:hypothetical protein